MTSSQDPKRLKGVRFQGGDDLTCRPWPLAVDFFVSLLNTVDDWAARSLAEVRRWEDTPLEERNQRGLRIFAQVPVDPSDAPMTTTPVAPGS